MLYSILDRRSSHDGPSKSRRMRTNIRDHSPIPQNMIFEDDKLVNGSLGRVIGFITQDDAEKQGRRIAMREDTGWFRGLPSPYARPPTDEQPSSDIQSSQATLVDYPCSQCPHKEQGCLCQSTRTRHLADSKTAVWPIVKFLREGEWVVGKFVSVLD